MTDKHCDHERVCKHNEFGSSPCNGKVYVPFIPIGAKTHTKKCPDDTRNKKSTAPGLNTQPKGCFCEDCIRFRKKDCPYPGSNITMTMCNSFLIDIINHDAKVIKDAREQLIREILMWRERAVFHNWSAEHLMEYEKRFLEFLRGGGK